MDVAQTDPVVARREGEPLVVAARVLDEDDKKGSHAISPVVRGERREPGGVAVTIGVLRRDAVEEGEIPHVSGELINLLVGRDQHIVDSVEVVRENIKVSCLDPHQWQRPVGTRLAADADAKCEPAPRIHLARGECGGIGQEQVVLECLQRPRLEREERGAEHSLVHGAAQKRVALEFHNFPAVLEFHVGHRMSHVFHEIEDVVLRGPRRVAGFAVIKIVERAPRLLDERCEVSQRRQRGELEALDMALRERIGMSVVGEARLLDRVLWDVLVARKIPYR